MGNVMSIMSAFTTQQAATLAKVSERQLGYWETTRVFKPQYVDVAIPGPFKKLYSFRDLVNLRVLGLLRNTHDVSLDELRKASDYLHAFSDAPWADLGLRLHGNHVAFRDPRSGEWVTAAPLGQRVMPLDLEGINRASECDVRESLARSPADYGNITRSRNVMSNAWILAGTRIPVEAVRSLRIAGASEDDVLAQYPSLVPDDIRAADQFDAAMRIA